MPADTKVERISRTVGKDTVIDELILTFTHDMEIDFMLPGIKPTGKKVELAHVVVMKFEGDKIAHEHIYWDQASLLAQVGLLNTKKLPVVGTEQAKRLLEVSSRKRKTAN
jgi:carboxymethylenebutenolidase